jgi:hypothetical protein
MAHPAWIIVRETLPLPTIIARIEAINHGSILDYWWALHIRRHLAETEWWQGRGYTDRWWDRRDSLLSLSNLKSPLYLTLKSYIIRKPLSRTTLEMAYFPFNLISIGVQLKPGRFILTLSCDKGMLVHFTSFWKSPLHRHAVDMLLKVCPLLSIYRWTMKKNFHSLNVLRVV